jgi:hydrogenase/urease accessory protein HupE
VATWVATVYFFLGIGLNLASRSKPERVVKTPLCAVLGMLCGVVSLS